jgi:hypothetical protein
MRSFIGSLMVLALVGVAGSAASAYSGSATRYASCICNYGYPDPVCRPVVSCMTEGGRCAQRCVPSRQSD